jgi:two-component system chemotaxis response regulator CheB
MREKIKVLVVDDMAMVRTILTQGLSLDPMIEVVGAAADPYMARDMIIKLKPDVMTLDVEMPKMDGLEFLRKLMPQWPIPVVMVSSLTERGKSITLEALQYGAVDFVLKPSSDVTRGLNAMLAELREKVRTASKVDVSSWKGKKVLINKPQEYLSGHSLDESTDKVVTIGASTGGTEALRSVICSLPSTTPGIVIVQHMPGGFTKMFAERLDKLAQMEVKEAENGDRVLRGRVLIAPGGFHMRVVRKGGIYEVVIEKGELVSGHCPSVDVLMHSVAENVGKNAIGIMLTGMGSDGAEGMKAMADAGAKNIAQDEASCVVFGMPRVAYQKGGAQELVSLGEIPKKIISLLRS